MYLKLVSNMEDPQEPVREQANKASSSPWRFETNWNFQEFEPESFGWFAKNIDFCSFQT